MFDFDILIGDFRNIISAIGRTSIQKDCLVPRSVCDRHPEEVDTMQRHGMVCKLGNGKMQLSIFGNKQCYSPIAASECEGTCSKRVSYCF